MVYYHGKAKAKWKKWKNKEEQRLKSLGVSEDIIEQLREYDWNVFKVERRIKSRQNPTSVTLFNNVASYDKKEILTIKDLLDEIENEALFQYLLQTDKTTLNIILLKIKGYSTKEISEILKISPSLIYSRIHRLKKILKKIDEDAKK